MSEIQTNLEITFFKIKIIANHPTFYNQDSAFLYEKRLHHPGWNVSPSLFSNEFQDTSADIVENKKKKTG
jgi:hypothetical protein